MWFGSWFGRLTGVVSGVVYDKVDVSIVENLINVEIEALIIGAALDVSPISIEVIDDTETAIKDNVLHTELIENRIC